MFTHVRNALRSAHGSLDVAKDSLDLNRQLDEYRLDVVEALQAIARPGVRYRPEMTVEAKDEILVVNVLYHPVAEPGTPEAEVQFLMALCKQGISSDDGARVLQEIEHHDGEHATLVELGDRQALVFPDTWPLGFGNLVGFFGGCGVCIWPAVAEAA